MLIGYARVSTDDQKLDLQVEALSKAGCAQIFKDKGQSGSQFQRAGLEIALANLRKGNTLVVWRLDRLGRSLSGLVGLMEHLGRRGIHFRSITEHIDTTSSGGKLMFHMMAALAEFERSIISERTRAGMAAAKARGAPVGRPKALSPDQLRSAYCSIHCDGCRPCDIAAAFGVALRTLQRNMVASEALELTCPNCSLGRAELLGRGNAVRGTKAAERRHGPAISGEGPLEGTWNQGTAADAPVSGAYGTSGNMGRRSGPDDPSSG